MNYQECKICHGTGLVMTQNGEDDVNQEICDWCDGTGKEGDEQK